ncbi:MAG: hypothetical protein HOL17_10295 [Gammaproteobacteria bacterium]|jgi:hypothetical protein|nr:hypothetical protein [Gammaproteobacteria bacterium]MBT4606310.1 hypothetical protein [Thiotrichales bacterium]MBT5467866.1 hypothetical protein [Candidatus Neomarinimicrobiota bacterium]MBT5372098.1 hypothetical protein [Gammaproteobacteria bacterium]MBT5746622.1 hypothetical protein [Gammaproteobacteria bacterium]
MMRAKSENQQDDKTVTTNTSATHAEAKPATKPAAAKEKDTEPVMRKEATQQESLTTLHQGICNKMSSRAIGKLEYELGYSQQGEDLLLRISSSNSGGFFSKEWITLSAISQLLNELSKTKKPFIAPRFAPLFISKSQNNQGFMAAALIDLKLIQRVSLKQYQLQVVDGGVVALQNQWMEQVKKISSEVGSNRKPAKPSVSTKPVKSTVSTKAATPATTKAAAATISS